MKNGQGFVLVYSVTSPTSFDHAAKIQKQILRIKEDTPDIPIMLVANKIDLEEERAISTEEGKNLAKELNCGYIEASAKTNHNINEIFDRLVKRVNKWREEHPVAQAQTKKGRCNLF
jgi:small GTP-binding protein